MSSDSIIEVSDKIHDLWFDIDALDLDQSSGRVVLPLALHKDGTSIGCLVISGVVGMQVVDTEKVGKYDIYSLEFDDLNRSLHLRGNIPIDIVFDIDAVGSVEFIADGVGTVGFG